MPRSERLASAFTCVTTRSKNAMRSECFGYLASGIVVLSVKQLRRCKPEL